MKEKRDESWCHVDIMSTVNDHFNGINHDMG